MDVISLAAAPERADSLPFGPGWPKFLFRDPVAARLMPRIDELFRDLHLLLLEDDEIIAGGWGVPIRWHATLDDLPAGWDGALERAIACHDSDETPNTLCAMATEVVGTARGRALSGDVLSALRDAGAARGLAPMLAPARPTRKHRYPLTPIAEYATWTLEDGTAFDPWIRQHLAIGGKILTTVEEAMRITTNVADWEQLTEMAFPADGTYVVPDALAPVVIDRTADVGTYVEPAIWIRHG
jgi:hypothetical protein